MRMTRCTREGWRRRAPSMNAESMSSKEWVALPKTSDSMRIHAIS